MRTQRPFAGKSGRTGGRMLLVCGVMLAVAAGTLRAQTPAQERFFDSREFLDEEIRQRLDADRPAEQPALLEYGGYIIPQWQQYDDNGGTANFRQVDLRLWGQAVVDDIHRIYARMRLVYTDFGPGDSPFGWRSDWEGPNLDQGFYELWLSEAARRWTDEPWPADVRVRVGRQFVELGQGLALSRVLDGGTVSAETGRWRWTGLWAQTILSSENIDRSPAVAGHSDRVMAGVQLEYLGGTRFQPYLYWFNQHDSTNEDPVNFLQDFDYNSQYLGLGATGELCRDLRYGTELVFETGESHNRRPASSGTTAIRAMAFDAKLEYFVPHPTEPVLSAEYALATGDDDRVLANATIGGNATGHDNAFLGFGFINTGYSFAPEFTNLQFTRLGGRFKPIPDHPCLRRLEVGSDWFAYWKQKEDGPVSDVGANQNDRFLGQEVDVYANWRVLSDLSLIVRYGRFWAGDAFAQSEKRDFVYAGVIYNF